MPQLDPLFLSLVDWEHKVDTDELYYPRDK